MRSLIRFAMYATIVLLVIVLVTWAGFFAISHPPGPKAVLAEELLPIQLPAPQMEGGKPLMQALSLRHTTRAFADKPLPMQTLSNLLWAAFGVNRSRTVMPGLGRTAPSAWNKQEIEIEVVLADGTYIYDAEHNLLRPAMAGDQRAAVGPPPAAKAAVTLIYVAGASDQFAQVDCGFIGQNVYLFAASERLNAWFYSIRSAEAGKALQLPAGRVALYGQSVGYPAQ